MRRVVSALFSNRLLWLKIALPASVLVCFSILSGVQGPRLLPRFTDFLKEPERFDGAELLVQFTMIERYAGPGRFVVHDIWGNRIEVLGQIPEGQDGCFISFRAKFKAPGYLILGKPWHIYRYDTAKLIVSAAALLTLLVLFARSFGLNIRRLRFEERR